MKSPVVEGGEIVRDEQGRSPEPSAVSGCLLSHDHVVSQGDEIKSIVGYQLDLLV